MHPKCRLSSDRCVEVTLQSGVLAGFARFGMTHRDGPMADGTLRGASRSTLLGPLVRLVPRSRDMSVGRRSREAAGSWAFSFIRGFNGWKCLQPSSKGIIKLSGY